MSSNILEQDFGSDSEEEDFNPAPTRASDDESGNDDDQGSDDEAPQQKPSNGKRAEADDGENDGEEDEDEDAPQGEDLEGGDDEEDDEEEEEEDDDEEAVSGRPRKRRKRGGLKSFFEEEAEVDEDDEGDEDDEDAMNDPFVAETHPDDLALAPGEENDDRLHRKLDRRRELEQTMDAEKQAAELRERYGRKAAASGDAVVVPRRLLLPSVEDPNIWGVRCKPGKEREIIFSIQKRLQERPPGTRNGLGIFSAFERGGTMSGYIYVEAKSKVDVVEALENINFCYPRGKVIMVTLKEMPDLLRVTKTEELDPGDWVRIKRGKYQGDLALVEEVDANGLEITVKVVPRLDYGLNEDNQSRLDADAKRKRAFGRNSAVNRPPQRLFSESEAKKKHARFLSATTSLGGKTFTYLGDTYIDGFLVKEMKIQFLQVTNVNPQLDEVTKFARGGEDGTANLDLASLAATLKKTTTDDAFLTGDAVEVFEGEQEGVKGKTLSTRGDIVTLRITEGEFKGQTIDVPKANLRKRFNEGDHVKVIGGSRFRDEVGMVVKVRDDRVTVLTDMTLNEITVFSKDLREVADSGGDVASTGYDVHDLVQLDPSTAACVIKADRESLRVLDQNGSVRTILPSQVTNLIEPRRNAVATDRNGSEIRLGDKVKEVIGEGKTGSILHIYRSFLFLHNRTQTENSGLMVTRASNVATVAAKGGRPGATGPDLTKMNPAMAKGGATATMAPPRSFGRDRLLGKTVQIRKGDGKGLIGIVKDVTETHARIELHTKNVVKSVLKDNIAVKDPYTGQLVDVRGGGRGGFGGSRVPYGSGAPRNDEWAGGRTPMAAGDSSRTPAWGGSSSRTPAWAGPSAASGSRTPGWGAGNAGNRTSYGGATSYGGSTAYGGPSMSGSRTPASAWNSGARTPHESNHGFSSNSDAFASGSRTPGYSSSAAAGGRTPAWGQSSSNAQSASSSRPYDAPTPGGDYSAPTPGAWGSAPTPGASGSAPTPRPWADSAPTPGVYNAPTPGAWNAPTPGAGMGAVSTPGAYGYGNGGDDDGPRYVDDD